VRPLILNSESIYYEKALHAPEQIIGADKINEEIDVAWRHGYWRHVGGTLVISMGHCSATNRIGVNRPGNGVDVSKDNDQQRRLCAITLLTPSRLQNESAGNERY
jgi:hypothetical protein